MHRFIAVQVQHPRISYAALLRLDKPNRRSRRLVTLSEGQQEAIVDVLLLEHSKGEEPRVLRRLHTFHLTNLPARSAGRTQMVLDGSYDGRGRADLSISVGGRRHGSTSLTVPPDKRGAIWPVAAAALLLLLVAGGGWWLWSSLTGFDALPEEPEPVAESARLPEPAPTEEPPEPQRVSPEEPPSPTEEGSGTAPDEGSTGIGESPGGGRAGGDATEGPGLEVEPPPQREYAVYFEPDETELTEPAREELREIAGVLQRFPEAQVRIVGHTALFGTEEGRIEISRGRARNVFQFLRREGWEPEAEPTVAWEASTDPVTLDREEQQLNRRVEIEIGSESTP